MRASRRVWKVAFVGLLSFGLASFGLTTIARAQSQVGDQALAERVLGPQWKQLSRRPGMIFVGTVLSGSSATLATDRAEAPPFSVELRFRVDRAIAGVERGQVLTIHEWTGATSMHRPTSVGQKVLLLLYPLSRLGLTSPVGGSLGVILLDAEGNYVTSEEMVRRGVIVSRAAALPVATPRPTGRVNVEQLERAISSARED
jgi:hypothetical protein